MPRPLPVRNQHSAEQIRARRHRRPAAAPAEFDLSVGRMHRCRYPPWRNRITSPSCTMYSLPSSRTCAFSRAAAKLPAVEQVFPLHHVRLDEILLDVAVNRARGLLRGHAALDRPRAAFRLAAGEKRNQPQQPVARLNQPVAAGFRAGRRRFIISAASASSSSASSASIFPQNGTTAVCGFDASFSR